MRIGFLCPEPSLSGGIHVICQWANRLSAHHAVNVVVPGRPPSRFPFVDEIKFLPLSLTEARNIEFDLVFATWWETAFWLRQLKSKRMAMLMQALESQFYGGLAQHSHAIHAILSTGLPLVTISHWLGDALTLFPGSNYVGTVLNGIDYARWQHAKPLLKRQGEFRVLVEGHGTEPRKNVANTLRLLEKLHVPYIVVGPQTRPLSQGDYCHGSFENVPYEQMPSLMRSCDVLLKLSTAEGMFGPPLEMFAAGGTAVCWQVNGHEEYMAHGYNSLLAPLHDYAEIAGAVELLRSDALTLARLKEGAKKTAAMWPSWSEQEASIVGAIDRIPSIDRSQVLNAVARAEVDFIRWGS